MLEGSIDHAEVLGDTLEGLVIHTCHTADAVSAAGAGAGAAPGSAPTTFAASDVVRMIENGETSVVKFKFPAYTVRTMCMRSALKTVRLDADLNGQSKLGELLPTENLLEDTDGLLHRRGDNATHHCHLSAAACCSLFLLTCALVMASSRSKAKVISEHQCRWASMATL